MNEMVERVAKALFDAKLQVGGGGRTLMPWPVCPEAPWCRETAISVIKIIDEARSQQGAELS
jgi:hypothetical protein